MGIFGSSSGLSPELIAQLAGGLVGFPKLPYSRAATVELNGDRAQIIPSADDVIREVFVRNTTEQPLTLFLANQEIKMSELKPGKQFGHNTNSGIAVEAIGTGTIEIIIQQDKPINYAIGADMVFPVKVTPLIKTGEGFSFTTAEIQDSPSSTFNQNISKLFNSDDGGTGYKAAAISCYTPGAPIDFTVSIAGDRYDTSQAIQFQYVTPISVARVLLAIASDVANLELSLISDKIGGLITADGYGGQCPGTGGTMTLEPDNLRFVGRFVTVNQSTGMYDTAIITSYTPNPDPLLGGTFVLEGF